MQNKKLIIKIHIIIIIEIYIKLMDQFLDLSVDFKESKKARYNEKNKICKNVATYGANIDDILFVSRNGEYVNISIQLETPIESLLNDLHVHEIYLNIKSGYTKFSIRVCHHSINSFCER
jgi:hypothetical protein